MNEKDEFGINDGFELEPIAPTEIIVEDAPMDNADSYDLEAARQNIHHLLQKGSVALDELLSVARQSQSIDGFEQVTKMLKALSDINKDLITVQEKKKHLRIKDDVPGDKEAQVINNNLFVGTTDELDKIIDMQRNKNG